MIYREIEEIECELKRIDERIHSKESLLIKFPDDVGLQLSIMDFESLKEDLIRELSVVKKEPTIYTNYIINRLKKTQEILFKNRNMLAAFPDNEEIIGEIEYLELMEKGLIEELEYCNLKAGFTIYEMRLKGEGVNGFKIPIAKLGRILLDIQEIPSSISKFVYSQEKERIVPVLIKDTVQNSLSGKTIDETALKKKDKSVQSKAKGILSNEMVDNNQFLSMGMISGSVRIFLTSPQPTLNNETLTDSIVIFKNLINCGNDKESIIQEMKKLGDPEPILKYRNFLHTLYKNNIDVEFSGKTKEFEDFNIFKIDHKEAKKIYHTLNKKDDSLTKEIIEIGTLRAVDLDARTFKFHIDDQDKLIPGYFKESLDNEMEEKTFHDTYKIKFLSSIPTSKLKNTTIKYEILEFL